MKLVLDIKSGTVMIHLPSIRFWIFVLLFVIDFRLYGQDIKFALDTSSFYKWPTVNGLDPGSVSKNGNYICYSISESGGIKTFLRSTHSKWEKEILNNVSGVFFSNDNKWAIYLIGGDSLKFVKLGSDEYRYIPHVKSFEIGNTGETSWIIYKLVDSSMDYVLVIKNDETGKLISFTNISDYHFYSKKGILLFIREKKFASSSSIRIESVNLISNEKRIYWSGEKLITYCFDEQNEQLAYIIQKNVVDSINWVIGYSNLVKGNSSISLNNIDIGTDTTLFLDPRSDMFFSDDGTKLYFNLFRKKQVNCLPNMLSKLSIWDYRMGDELNPIANNEDNVYRFCASLSKKNVFRLEKNDSEKILSSKEQMKHSRYFILRRILQESPFRTLSDIYLVNSEDDKRRLVVKDRFESVFGGTVSFISPNNKYFVYFDLAKKKYYSYDIAKNTAQLLGPNLDVDWLARNPLTGLSTTVGIAGWVENDGILIYDNWDIWMFDLKSNKSPVNITKGFGSTHHIKFRLYWDNIGKQPLIYRNGQQLTLCARNEDEETRGFFTTSIGLNVYPKMLSMKPCVYSDFQKAIDANCWILRIETSVASPNLFYTSDFKRFKPLSDVHPEKKYKWLTSDLVRWKMFDDSIGKGVLYKPEDFDEKKHYPIIFKYYEDRACEKNEFHVPETSKDEINIPWFVTHGYLVFVPDIYFLDGKLPGECTINSIVSAANYLSGFTWINSKKMGLQGHSFGGFSTNYLVTHSNLFAAAASSAGASDFISFYGSIDGTSLSASKGFAEFGQNRLGSSLWENRELYFDNSPIFKANYINTPLLLLHNNKDGSVPQTQSIELFLALRRLGKPCWLLQYDGEGHGLTDPVSAIDFTLRITQYFDHYLKDALLPKWMAGDMSKSLELDPNAKEPAENEVYYGGKFQKVSEAIKNN